MRKQTGFLLDFANFFSLNFRNNYYLASCLKETKSLYFLDCALMDSSQLFFTDLVESSIQSLTLVCCKLGSTSLQALVTFLDSNSQVTFLDISQNNFLQCEDEIVNLLRRNSSLETLNLNDTSLPSTESFSYKICVALSENITLKSLQLRCYSEMKFNYDLFTTSLKYNPTLTNIRIKYEFMDWFLEPFRKFFLLEPLAVMGSTDWNIKRISTADSPREKIYSSNILNDAEFRLVEKLFTVERKFHAFI
jgi:hypothetical protein